MNRLIRISPIALLSLAVALSTAGCKSNQNTATTANPSTDPAAANMAPASTTTDQSSTASSAPATSDATQTAATSATTSADTSSATSSASSAPATYASGDTSTGTIEDASYGETPAVVAPQPPPPLPVYQQPVDPGDGYIWTPGYWNYASAGYFWVPGVWVQAPYEGALWTPGYWGWTHNHYGFFHGYWGPHIGFYGGINYGFGYVGTGYQGGYWNGGHFFYNRTVNNINVNVVHNVYEYRVPEPSIHISFNGGHGGINIRPRPAEMVAFREPHAPPMTAQIQIERTASTNKAQFVSENHGRPVNAFIDRPVMADHDVHPVAAPAPRMMAPEQHGPAMEPKPAQRLDVHSDPRVQTHPAAPRSEPRPLHASRSTPRHTPRHVPKQSPLPTKRPSLLRIPPASPSLKTSTPARGKPGSRVRNHSAVRTRIATRLRTRRAGRFSPLVTSCNGPLSPIALPSSMSATSTVPSCTSGVTSPIEYTTS